MIFPTPSLMKVGFKRMLMNPPGATDALSIKGPSGSAARIAVAAAIGSEGAFELPCDRTDSRRRFTQAWQPHSIEHQSGIGERGIHRLTVHTILILSRAATGQCTVRSTCDTVPQDHSTSVWASQLHGGTVPQRACAAFLSPTSAFEGDLKSTVLATHLQRFEERHCRVALKVAILVVGAFHNVGGCHPCRLRRRPRLEHSRVEDGLQRRLQTGLDCCAFSGLNESDTA